MNIKTRINARKVALSYIYQHCFFHNLLKQKSAMIEALFIDNIFQTQGEKFTEGQEDFKKKLQEYLVLPSNEEVVNFSEEFFDEWQKSDIDFDYLLKIVPKLGKYEQEIKEGVDTNTSSFHYDDMDTIDQSIFLLGYIERKELGTPKEILLNELIELAKRYSDEGAPKLINAVMHKIIS